MGAVVDGAGWCQTFVDLHDPEAVRILDFAHAAEYLSTIAQMPGADGPLLSSDEHVALRRSLKQTGPAAVLPRLREVVASQPRNDALTKALAYLDARVEQMQYPRFQAEGWPIGSGMVESANKLVVEDRLKGAGMHGAETNVNPLLALRNAIGNDRWDETWTVIEHEQRREVVVRRHGMRAHRSAPKRSEGVAVLAPLSIPVVEPLSIPVVEPLPTPAVEPEAKPVHPWRRAWSIRRQRELADAA